MLAKARRAWRLCRVSVKEGGPSPKLVRWPSGKTISKGVCDWVNRVRMRSTSPARRVGLAARFEGLVVERVRSVIRNVQGKEGSFTVAQEKPVEIGLSSTGEDGVGAFVGGHEEPEAARFFDRAASDTESNRPVTTGRIRTGATGRKRGRWVGTHAGGQRCRPATAIR